MYSVRVLQQSELKLQHVPVRLTLFRIDIYDAGFEASISTFYNTLQYRV